MTQPLMEWPERSVYRDNTFGRRAYRAEAYDAAMARLRVAVPLLYEAYMSALLEPAPCALAKRIREALELIGDLPPPPSGAL